MRSRSTVTSTSSSRHGELAEIDADLKVVTDRILTMIAGVERMTTKPKRQKSALAVPQPDPDGFAEIVALIATSQQNAYRAVNTALIDLYWQVGEYISRKIESAEWGSGNGRRI